MYFKTLEPCAMCAQGYFSIKIQKLIFGVYDPKDMVLNTVTGYLIKTCAIIDPNNRGI